MRRPADITGRLLAFVSHDKGLIRLRFTRADGMAAVQGHAVVVGIDRAELATILESVKDLPAGHAFTPRELAAWLRNSQRELYAEHGYQGT